MDEQDKKEAGRKRFFEVSIANLLTLILVIAQAVAVYSSLHEQDAVAALERLQMKADLARLQTDGANVRQEIRQELRDIREEMKTMNSRLEGWGRRP